MAGELGALLLSLGVATQGGGFVVPTQRRRGPAAAALALPSKAVTPAERVLAGLSEDPLPPPPSTQAVLAARAGLQAGLSSSRVETLAAYAVVKNLLPIPQAPLKAAEGGGTEPTDGLPQLTRFQEGNTMGLRINQNIDAMNSYRNLSVTQGQMSKSLEKLSSGFRINRAADDAAGLAISEGLRSQVGGLKVASRNAQDAISVVQTAEGALTEVHAILQRVRDLSVQAGNDSNNAAARTNIKTEIDSLGDELIRIGASTNFNGKKLLDGSATGLAALTFQVGASSVATESQVTVDLGLADVDAIGAAVKTLAVDTSANALLSVAAVDTHISTVSTERAKLGASQNRFESTINSLNVAVENLSASESRIRDTDMAQEMMQFTRSQILSQAGTAMLAQANQAPQGVLSLLR